MKEVKEYEVELDWLCNIKMSAAGRSEEDAIAIVMSVFSSMTEEDIRERMTIGNRNSVSCVHVNEKGVTSVKVVSL